MVLACLLQFYFESLHTLTFNVAMLIRLVVVGYLLPIEQLDQRLVLLFQDLENLLLHRELSLNVLEHYLLLFTLHAELLDQLSNSLWLLGNIT